MNSEIAKLKQIINESENIVFFTGAGISVPSGIPDFRSADGLYTNDLRAETIISHSYFMSHPKEFYQFYKDKMVYEDALPNIAHKWIAELEDSGKSKGVITQNIDGLHLMAGSKNVVEIHGTIYKNHCMKCHKSYALKDILKDEIPLCDCGGIIKPDVVLYEEALEYKDIVKAISMIEKADTLIIIGTSLSVYPAAGFIDYFNGKHLIVLNKGEIYTNIKDALIINDDIINIVNELHKL
ncbi:MAG: NAD-dependent protein deacylase [Erysipelotrichaceae bacterium]|nr:NAD-dependent protein deacylase [Erysipelotrichaceae bacterium]